MKNPADARALGIAFSLAERPSGLSSTVVTCELVTTLAWFCIT
jgi:hypothetical protein